MPLTFTLDLEDHRVGASAPLRCAEPTYIFLSWLESHGARGTVFVVGQLAAEQPDLVREIADAGHEIALHGYRHVPIEDLGQASFADELRRGKSLLEDLTGAPVDGYRAPIFSLTCRTPWAVEALAEAGFAYTSSVLPADSPLFGIADAPQRPFRWKDGPVELPCPVLGRGRASLPFLGGVYLRYLPGPLIAARARRAARVPGAWSYIHPYDLDPDEPFVVLPHAGYVTSRIVHHRRRGTLRRLDRIRALAGTGPLLRDVAASAASGPLPVVAFGSVGSDGRAPLEVREP